MGAAGAAVVLLQRHTAPPVSNPEPGPDDGESATATISTRYNLSDICKTLPARADLPAKFRKEKISAPRSQYNHSERVRTAVARAQQACEARPHCRFVNAYDALSQQGAAMPGALQNDGIHLAPMGYELLTALIRQAMKSGA